MFLLLAAKTALIQKFVDHPALDQTTKGIVDILKKNNIKTRVESAQANVCLASQMASKFAAQKPDIAVGIATVSAQSLLKYDQKGDFKLVFSSVTAPKEAGLSKNGVSNYIELKPQLELFKRIEPNLTCLGFLYSSAEVNSFALLKQLQKIAPGLGIKIIGVSVTKTGDVAQAAVKLANQCDAVFISNDSTALSAFKTIVRACSDKKIPVYVSDTDIVSQGALAAMGPNQYKVGAQTGRMIMRILESGKDQPIEYPEKTEVYINLKVAKKLGISVPQDIIKKADKVLQ